MAPLTRWDPIGLGAFCYRAPPSCEVRFFRQESAVPQPALVVPSWKTRARVVRTRAVPLAPPEESGRVVLLLTECVPSSTPPPWLPSPILSNYPNLQKVR